MDYYFDMSSKTKPFIVIVIAVAMAAGIAVYWSRQSSASGESTNNTMAAANPGGGHIRGKADAAVTLVEFGDYQCPACGFFYPIVEEVLQRYPDKVKLEFHHYPLIQMHPYALLAAKAAEAAGEQGKFWEMHDKLYQHQSEWSRSNNPEALFVAFAGEIGLDANKFMRALKSPETEKKILEDIQRGTDSKVNQTPSFFINGQALEPTPNGVNEFAAAIEAKIPATK